MSVVEGENTTSHVTMKENLDQIDEFPDSSNRGHSIEFIELNDHDDDSMTPPEQAKIPKEGRKKSVWERIQTQIAQIQKESNDFKRRLLGSSLRLFAFLSGIMLTLFFGALVFVYLNEAREPRMNYSLAFNWATATLTTVGYGDITPISDGAKVFAVFYMFFGLLFFTFLLGNVVACVQELRLALFPKDTNDDDDIVNFKDEYKKTLKSLMWAISGLVGITALGVIYYCLAENLRFLDSLYWSMETVTTVGYGDIINNFEVNSAGTVWFATFYMILGGGFYMSLLAYIASRFAKIHTLSHYDYLDRVGISQDMIARMDSDGDGEVTKDEFLRYMLIELGFCSQSNLRFIDGLFKGYDKDGDGTLDLNDLKFVTGQVGTVLSVLKRVKKTESNDGGSPRPASSMSNYHPTIEEANCSFAGTEIETFKSTKQLCD